MSKGLEWVGFDWDGTLVTDSGKDELEITGSLVPEVALRLHWHRAQGDTVKIFTARVSGEGWDPNDAEAAIRRACLRLLGFELEVTCKKDQHLRVFYDDRAVAVERNTGRIQNGPADKLVLETRATWDPEASAKMLEWTTKAPAVFGGEGELP